jgi:hypothetical protein
MHVPLSTHGRLHSVEFARPRRTCDQKMATYTIKRQTAPQLNFRHQISAGGCGKVPIACGNRACVEVVHAWANDNIINVGNSTIARNSVSDRTQRDAKDNVLLQDTERLVSTMTQHTANQSSPLIKIC